MHLATGNQSVFKFDEIESELANSACRLSLFSDEDFRTRLFRRLNEDLPTNGILSLDVFDTLLLRDNSSELSRFVEVGERMSRIFKAHVSGGEASYAPDGTKPTKAGVDAFLARYLGTQSTYRARGKIDGAREGSLNEIHSVASKLMIGSNQLVDAFIDCELHYEAETLTVNPALMEYVLAHIGRGGVVILITDMYMHASQVSKLLGLVGVKTELFEQIISSADTSISKASGKIFIEAQRRVDRQPSEFFHVGDSYHGDYRQPRNAGWHALHLPLSSADIEQRIQSHLVTSAMLQHEYGIQVKITAPRRD